MKVLINKEKSFLITDTTKDFHTADGFIKKEDLTLPNGSIVKTNKDVSYSIIDSQFIDVYNKMKRGAAIIIPKELGVILANTMVDKDSICVDAGGGSGALTCFLARYVKHVHCFDIREDHLKTVEYNIKKLNLTNVTAAVGNVYESIPVENVDLITLDVPEPWLALEHVSKSLKPGGFLVCYVPHAHQIQQTAIALQKREDFVLTKICETIEREWDADERKCRPQNMGLMHTAFLLFARKIS